MFEGWYWFEEIIMAIENGVEIIKIEKTITAQYYDNFIKDFVEINKKIRELGPLHKQIGKNNNNTFYGRLGMNPERLEEELISSIDESKKYEKVIETNGIYIGYLKKDKSISNVLISGCLGISNCKSVQARTTQSTFLSTKLSIILISSSLSLLFCCPITKL